MQDAGALDLGMYRQVAPTAAAAPRRSMRCTRRRADGGLVAGDRDCSDAFGLGSLIRAFASAQPASTAQRAAAERLRQVAAMNVDDKAQIVVEGADAQQRNAAIPLSGLPLELVGRVQHGRCQCRPTPLRSLPDPGGLLRSRLSSRCRVAGRWLRSCSTGCAIRPIPTASAAWSIRARSAAPAASSALPATASLLRGPAAAPWREAEAVARSSAGWLRRTECRHGDPLPRRLRAAEMGIRARQDRARSAATSSIASRAAGAAPGLSPTATRLPSAFLRSTLPRLRARLDDQGEVPLLAPEQPLTPGLTVAPHVTDRHAETDVGGRLDTTKEWRLSIPDPVAASSRYRQTLGAAGSCRTQAAERAVGLASADAQPKADDRAMMAMFARMRWTTGMPAAG